MFLGLITGGVNRHYKVALWFFEVISDPAVPFHPHTGRTNKDSCLTEATGSSVL
jgi:hypothetical protein